MPETLQELLERAAGFPEAGLRFLDRNERETWVAWPEIRQRAEEVAGGIKALGLARGERVGLVYPTSPEFVIAFFGVLAAGCVPAPLYPPVRLGRLAEYHQRTARLIQAVGAPLLLVDAQVRRLLGETVARARPRLGALALDELPAAAASLDSGSAEDLGLIQFSSGTTVEPKPVALSQRALLAQVQILNSFWPDREGVTHSGVSWLPLYHDMGLIGCLFPAVERPGVVTLLGPELFVQRPALWLRAIARYGATISGAPNFAYSLAADRIQDEELSGCDLSCWQIALCGAETVVPEVLRRFAQRFAPWGFLREALTPVYGLSEAALAVTFSALGEPFRTGRFSRAALAEEGVALPNPDGAEIVAVGRAVPGFRLAIRDGNGQALPPGRTGRVWVSGPSLMEGYFGSPAESAEALVSGWLDTGDLGFLWAGDLYLTGRAKDVLLLRGRTYSPGEVEQAVAELPGVRPGGLAAASYLPQGADSERLLLLVEFRHEATEEERSALPEDCRRAVLGALGLALDEVLLLAPGTLPRTSSGKIRRGEALRLFLAGELKGPQPVNAWRMGWTLARSHLALRRFFREAGEVGEATNDLTASDELGDADPRDTDSEKSH